MPEFRNPSLESQGSGGGPGNSGGDFRSLITFASLAVVLFLAFQFFKPKQDATPPTPQTQQQATTPASSSASQSSAADSAPAMMMAMTPGVTAASETDTVVENELYRIVFTNRGAQVKHWILKKYFDTAGKPLDLVQPQLAQRFGLPLSLLHLPESPISPRD